MTNHFKYLFFTKNKTTLKERNKCTVTSKSSCSYDRRESPLFGWRLFVCSFEQVLKFYFHVGSRVSRCHNCSLVTQERGWTRCESILCVPQSFLVARKEDWGKQARWNKIKKRKWNKFKHLSFFSIWQTTSGGRIEIWQIGIEMTTERCYENIVRGLKFNIIRLT